MLVSAAETVHDIISFCHFVHLFCHVDSELFGVVVLSQPFTALESALISNNCSTKNGEVL